MARRRIDLELKEIYEDPPDGIKIMADPTDFKLWNVSMLVPTESLFEGCKFQLKVQFPEEYPRKPPVVKFESEMFHPNIALDGTVCLYVLQHCWLQKLTMRTILTLVQYLLAEPDIPSNMTAAQLYKDDRAEYARKVQMMAHKSQKVQPATYQPVTAIDVETLQLGPKENDSKTSQSLGVVKNTSLTVPASATNERLRNEAPKAFDVFLSHNWGAGSVNHARVKKINEELKSLGYVTWFDDDRMTGIIQISMAEGIEKSRIGLVFITSEYMTKVNGDAEKGFSDNCFLEYKHLIAKVTLDNMLCIIMEEEMEDDSKWKGQLQIHTAGRHHLKISKYIKRDTIDWVTAVKDLQNKIGIHLKKGTHQVASTRSGNNDGIQLVNYSERPGYDVFISSSWGKEGNPSVEIINEELKTIGYKTCSPNDRKTDDVHNTIASRIENSRLAIVFLDKKYEDKLNKKTRKGHRDKCYWELKHCIMRLTPERMFCGVLEERMLNDAAWTGMLGITMAGRLYIRITENLKHADVLSDVMASLKARIDEILQNTGNDFTAITQDDNFICWKTEGAFYYAFCIDVTEDILVEDVLKLSKEDATWNAVADIETSTHYPGKDTGFRVMGVNTSTLDLQKVTYRIVIKVRNKNTGNIRKLNIPLPSLVSHVCKPNLPKNKGTTITVYAHIEDEEERKKLLNCTRPERKESTESSSVVTTAGGLEQKVNKEFNWEEQCLTSGYFVRGKSTMVDLEDKTEMHVEDWQDAANEQWRKCFSLQNHIVRDRQGTAVSLVTTALEKLFEGKGLFVFTGYSVKDHLKFLGKSYDEEDNKIEVNEEDELNPITTSLLFAPDFHLVLLILELPNSEENHSNLLKLHRALTILPKMIRQFIHLHHHHLIDTYLSIVPWVLVPGMEVEKLEFPPCCIACLQFVFFKENLIEETPTISRWNELLKKLPKIPNPSRQCREGYKNFMASVIAFLSTTDIFLPSPTDTTSACVKKIFLTKIQRKILSENASHAYITGGYGSGKSVVLQRKLLYLIQSVDAEDVIVYVCFNTKSLVVQSMKQAVKGMLDQYTGDDVPTIHVGNNVELAKEFGMTETPDLKLFIQMVSEKSNNSVTYHLIGDEYDPSALSIQSALAIKGFLTGTTKSTVWIASIPMKKNRVKIKNDRTEQLTVGYHLEETGMVHLSLGCVFRFTEEISELLRVGAEVIKRNKSKYHYADETIEIESSKNAQGLKDLQISENPNKSADILTLNDDEKASQELGDLQFSKDVTLSVDKREKDEEVKRDGKLGEQGIGFDDLDHIFKMKEDTMEMTGASAEIHTTVDFWESTPSEYNVGGDIPVLIDLDHPVQQESGESKLIFKLYVIFMEIVKVCDSTSIAIMATTLSEADRCEKALMLLSKCDGIKYSVYLPTLRPNDREQAEGIDVSKAKILLSDIDGLTGLEFEKVVIPLTLSERFLSFALTRTLSRSQNEVFLVILPSEVPSGNSTTKEIVDTWKKRKLVKQYWIKLEESCRCPRDEMNSKVFFCAEELRGQGIWFYFACSRLFQDIKKDLEIVEREEARKDWYKEQYNVEGRHLVEMLKNNSADAHQATALVSLAYEAKRIGELSLKVGDVIENITQQKYGWWRGDLKGRNGLFHADFVNIINQKDGNDDSIGGATNSVKSTVLSPQKGEDMNSSDEEVPTKKKMKMKKLFGGKEEKMAKGKKKKKKQDKDEIAGPTKSEPGEKNVLRKGGENSKVPSKQYYTKKGAKMK